MIFPEAAAPWRNGRVPVETYAENGYGAERPSQAAIDGPAGVRVRTPGTGCRRGFSDLALISFDFCMGFWRSSSEGAQANYPDAEGGL